MADIVIPGGAGLSGESGLDILRDAAGIRARDAVETGTYLTNRGTADDRHPAVGFVDGTPAVPMSDPAMPASFDYFGLPRRRDRTFIAIGDLRHAHHVTAGAATAHM